MVDKKQHLNPPVNPSLKKTLSKVQIKPSSLPASLIQSPLASCAEQLTEEKGILVTSASGPGCDLPPFPHTAISH